MLRSFFTTFFAGLLAMLPLIVTLGVVGFIVGKLNAWVGPESAFGRSIGQLASKVGLPSSTLVYVLSLLSVILLVWLLGLYVRRFTARRIGAGITAIMGRIPFINKIYSSTDQVIALLTRREGDAAAALSHVVMARIGNARVLGMLSSPEPVLVDGTPHYIVFLPSTPVPASGQNILVPVEDVVPMDISVEEMTKILISLGSLGPGILNPKLEAAASTLPSA
jgi:uncharacterized membrane protein